jgi:hypothetical protein
MSEESKKPIPGLRVWKNKGNGFTCVELHYTADPDKRSPEWKKKASYGMDSKAWNTEMELSWETYAGSPVFGKEFNRELHVFKERVEPNREQPTIIRGWDFGGNHSCAVVQYIAGRVIVLDEYANLGYNTRRIARDVVEDCNLRYGQGFRFVEVIDPSGLHEGKTSTGQACADVMRDMNLEIIPGEQDPTRRVDAVMQFLISMKSGKPCLQLNPGCHMLIDGFLGGYHYPEHETQNQKKNRPEKNEYSHIHDALQYACTRIADIGNPEVFLLPKGEDEPDGGYRIF